MEKRGRRATLIAATVLALLPFLLYSGSLDAPFVADDLDYIRFSPDILKLSFPDVLLKLRPLSKLTFWMNQRFDPNAMPGYHLVNITLHGLVGILLFLLIRRILESRGKEGTAFAPALVCALLFEAHPIQSQAVIYTFARSELLCALFLFAALLVHLGKKAEEYSYLRGTAVALLFLLALASKERAFLLVPGIVLFDLWVRKGESHAQRFRRWHRLAIPLSLAVVLGLINFFIGFKDQHAGGFAQGQDVPAFLPYFLTQFVVRVHYLKLFFWPSDLSFNYYFEPRDSLADPVLLGAIGLHLALFIGAILWFRRDSRVAFAVCWFFLLLLPTSGAVPAAVSMHEHWVYIPSLGVFLIVGLVLQGLGKPLWISILATAALIPLGTVTCLRARVWQSPVSLWLHASRYAAKVPWVWNNLGMALLEEQDYPRARIYLEKALESGAFPGAVHHNLGLCDLREGKLQSALEHFNKALPLCPDQPEVLVSLAETHSLLKNHRLAAECFRRAAQLGVPRPGLYFETAEALLELGEKEKAKRTLEEGRKVFPNNQKIADLLEGMDHE